MSQVFSRRHALAVGAATGISALSGCARPGGLSWAKSRAPKVRVNQVGYFPCGPKRAVLESGSTQPIAVQLLQNGRVVWSGASLPFGPDAASGDRVHHIDFSSFGGTGDHYELRAEGSTSFPFRIDDAIYDQLPYDALKYFYHNRSGVSIVTPYVPDATWSRPAGHLSDVDVPCWGQQTCAYRLDVSGGWYDAGDHGKYVVCGGISAWTLLAMYERFVHLGRGIEPYGDGKLHIPESGNGCADLLDEARYELQFLLKMQVPAGQPLEGMVHHKVHDNAWTPLAIEPPPYAEHRGVHRPSTAATLNLAAVAAQAARIFRDIDAAFADVCLAAAQRAFIAAERTPDMYAPPLDNQGGGPYDDAQVSDEFFWAAAELFITTNHPAYLQRIERSPHFSSFPTRLGRADGTQDGDGVTGSMTWQSTAALGWISLAVVDSDLSAQQRARLREGIVSAGAFYSEIMEAEGYLLPLGLGEQKKYPWGSNSFVLNNLLVQSLAYDFTGADDFAKAVATGMDYLLGRNPLQQCYVTGYGSVPLRHPHHRFWADQKSSRFPPPPPGAVSGGPNSSLQDPQTKRSGLHRGLPPQKCFVDHIDAWSVNEVTINWNAPLAWVAAFLREWRGGRGKC